MESKEPDFYFGLPMIPFYLGVENGGRYFTGVGSKICNVFIEPVIKANISYGIIENPPAKMGTYDPWTGYYDGLVGLLQNGSVDFGPVLYSPVSDPYDSFIQLPTLADDTMTMASFYTVPNATHDENLFFMFTAVPVELWIGYLAAFFTFVTVSYLGTLLMKRQYSALWNTICAFLDQDNYPTDSSLFIKLLSFIVMLCMFFLFSYMENCMSTDLVTIEKAIAIKSYQDILDRNGKTKVEMYETLAEYSLFHAAEKGSIEHEVFKVVEPAVPGPATCSRYYDQSLLEIGRPFSAAIKALVCAANGNFPKEWGRMLISSDRNAKRYINIYLLSSKWKGTIVEFLYIQQLRRMLEHGLIVEFSDGAPGSIVEAIYGPDANRLSVHLKVTQHVEEGSGSFKDIGWNHFYPVLYLLLAGFLLASFVLISEWKFLKRNQSMELKSNLQPFFPADIDGRGTWRTHLRGRDITDFLIVRKGCAQEKSKSNTGNSIEMTAQELLEEGEMFATCSEPYNEISKAYLNLLKGNDSKPTTQCETV